VLRDIPPPPPAMPALPELAPLDAAAPAAKAPAVSFVLREFHVKGATALQPERITQLTDPYMGKPMGEAELGALVGALRKAYDDLGLGLTAVGFPTQDVSQGVLNIDVVEPKLGRIQIPTGTDAPVTAQRVQGLLALFCLKTGAPLNTRALERVMFALNDTPGVQAKASLSPAGDEGVYNLSIQAQPRRAWDAVLAGDNHGIGDAGRWRTMGMLRLNNPLGIGDNLDVQAMLSNTRDVKVGRVAYELPVGYTPARLSLAYAKVVYSLGGQFESYDAHGVARVVESNLTYPLIRSRTRTLMARLGGEAKSLTDELGAFDSRRDKRILGAVAALNYESRDGLLGGGFTGASAQFHWGHLRFKSTDQQAEDAALGDYGMAGRFGKVELQYARLQALDRTVSLYGSVRQQLASRNLDPAEKIGLGGPRGVRAYPTTEGASDEATLLTGELRYWIDPNCTVFALYDWAKGRRVRNVPATELPSNDIFLRGAGVGLALSYPQWATIKATLAWRGKQRAETDTGHDQPRLYLQAHHTF
jgi:hemolysin activation/secretion protein